jgi:DNA-binding NarL/FixJ family response regulator
MTRGAGPALAANALGAALEAIGGPAFVVRRSGRVAQASSAGRAILARAPAALVDALRSEVAGSGQVTRVTSEGVPEHFLLVPRRSPADPEPRLEAFARRYRITACQRDVLARLVRGDANKTVATELPCAESTVELHVTTLLARTQCPSRAALVAHF